MQTCTLRSWLLGLLLLLAGAAPARAQRVAASQNFTLSIHPDGTLWAWGQGNSGQLGLGSYAYQVAPRQVGTASNWQSVSAGYNHVVALRTDGTLWAWGYNGFGQLGLGAANGYTLTPTQVGTVSTWLSASAGYNCTLAIRTDGTLWAWGYNGYGQLGLGAASNTNQPSPTQVGTAATWQSLSAGGGHTLALQTDGSLWAWGRNDAGQLGQGTTASATGPVRVGTATWTSVGAGPGCSLAVRQDGTLWAWGGNDQGQLGLGAAAGASQLAPAQVGPATTWQRVAPGSGFALALRQDGSLCAWGYNRWGQLGTGAGTASQPTPVQVGTAATWADISAGFAHAAALRQDGTLWAWGGNYLGQVGAGAGGPQLLPGQVASAASWASLGFGTDHLLGIRTDGLLRAWGANSSGQLGDGTTTDQDLPVAVGTSAWQSVASGSSVTLGIRPDGSLWAWGNNYYGQLGTGAALTYSTATPVRVGTASNWQSVVIGVGHVLAIQTDGSLWAWGSNDYGQLGTGSTTATTTPVRVGTASWLSIGAGWMHSAAVRQDGTLWTWGSNNQGQLGTGTAPASSLIPTQVGASTAWRSLSAGVYYTLALRADGTLWAWGHNNYGELGVGSPGNNVATPTQVGSATTWRSVSAFGTSSLALRQDNTLWVWGANYYGQLGLGTTTDQFTPVQQGTATWQSAGMGSEYGAGIRLDGTLWTWGYNERGQLGNGLPGSATPLFIPNGGTPLAALAPAATTAWHLAPNPARGYAQLLGLPTGPVAGQLFDAQGRLARTTSTAALDLSGLAPGLYLLRATAGPTIRTLRLAVE